MASCDHCHQQVAQIFPITVYDERQDFRALADQDPNFEYYTGEVTIQVCLDCRVAITGNAPRSDVQPIINSFHIRTLQSGIASEIARALFEHCGYEVRHYGYEDTTPEWNNKLKAGDANPVAAKIKSRPDHKSGIARCG